MPFKKLNIQRQHYETELVHDDSLIHGINYIEQMNELDSIKEIDGNSWAIHDSKKIHDGGLFSIFDFFSKIFHYVLLIFSVIGLIIICFCGVKCILCLKEIRTNLMKSF